MAPQAHSVAGSSGWFNLISLGLSLAIVVTRNEKVVFKIVIALSVAFLLVVLALLFAGRFGREEEPVEQAEKAAP